ncbi:C2 calcium-dependent domain-containing protein 4C-like [Pleurodeles waltl]
MRLLERLGLNVEQSGRSFSFLFVDPGQAMRGKDRQYTNRQRKGSDCPYVLTPDKIPEFCIPPKLAPHPRTSTAPHHRSTPNLYVCSPSLRRSTPNLRAATLEPRGTHGGPDLPRLSLPFTQQHIIQIESAEELPFDMSCSDDESTNADPQSQAALSLPHLPKTHTSYGFCTLLESPNTRRKESIFHNDPLGAYGLLGLLPRSRSNTFCKGDSLPSGVSAAARLSPHYMHRQGAWDSDTTSSTESSPFSSPLLSRSPTKSNSLFKALSQDRLFSKAFNHRFGRPRTTSSSTDEGSSTDTSPYTPRRVSNSVEDSTVSQRGSISRSKFSMDLGYSRERFVGENTAFLDRGGVLRLSAEYCPDNERLRIRLISAEGLYDSSTDPKLISCCISLCLLPGKAQKQKSTIIRKSRNPIFNEDFFFVGISERDLYTRSLKFKAVNKTSSLKRDNVLGETELVLLNILSL